MPRSLTRRLLGLYLATMLVVIAIVSVLAWWLMRGVLHASLDESLRIEAVAVATHLEAHQGEIEFETAPAALRSLSSLSASKPVDRARDSGSELTGPIVQIQDEHGRVVYPASARVIDLPKGSSRAGSVPVGNTLLWTMHLPVSDSLYRVLALRVAVPAEDEDQVDQAKGAPVGAWVLVARSFAAIDHTLGQLALVLASAAGIATLMAVGGGLFVSRSAMQPVRSVAEEVGRVNPSKPVLSLDPGQVPIELQPMVTTTQRLLDRVRSELDCQRQLTADVAHDLRTPVAGVRTLLDVCLQRERSTAEYVSAMEKARAALRQLCELLDDVLTMARLEAAVDAPIAEEVLLDNAVTSAVAGVQPLAAASGVSIKSHVDPGITLCTDRVKLAKVISNLLSNAVQHSPSGSAVEIESRQKSDGVAILVTDRGPGIPPELRDRIFDRFVRGDTSRNSTDGHHGLGLPIAAGLAQLLGGEVSLDTQHTPGTRFVLRMPQMNGVTPGTATFDSGGVASHV